MYHNEQEFINTLPPQDSDNYGDDLNKLYFENLKIHFQIVKKLFDFEKELSN